MKRYTKADKDCENCCYLGPEGQVAGKTVHVCALTHVVLLENRALKCDFYNRDLSKEDVCYNCRYFIGGGDWGLACGKHYHMLPDATSKICDDFDRKSEE